MAPDVTGGIVMFAEEAADADTLDTPTTIPTQPSVAPSGTQKRSRRTKTPDPAPAEPAFDREDDDAPHPADEGHDKPTEAQTKMAMALFADLGNHRHPRRRPTRRR
jgi:hypothetical protein